jgi:uncharacterized membrane protein
MSHAGFARVLFVVFFVLVSSLLLALRRMRRVVEEERVDAVLLEEMDLEASRHARRPS